MKTRKVCIMGRLLDQDDGLGVYASNLLRHMFGLDPNSLYLLLLRTDKNASLFNACPNVAIKVVPSRSKLYWDQVVVPKEARRFGADLIFHPKFSLPLFTRIPGVFVLHGSDWFRNPGNYLWHDNLYVRIMLPIYCRKARRLLAISQVVVDDLVDFVKVKRSKIRVSHAAAAPHFAAIEDVYSLRKFSQRYKLPAKFILTVGRVHHTGNDGMEEYPGGNNENLVRGFQYYRASGGTLPLVVVGKHIDKYLRSHGFGDHDLQDIFFTGYIPNTEIVKAYNLAEFFVVATLYESFCLPLVEAMACGCPAIVPETGGCPEVGGTAARYVNPLDPASIGRAMLAVAGSTGLRGQMRKTGCERAAMFTWERTARTTLAVFDEICPPAGYSSKTYGLRSVSSDAVECEHP